MYHKWAYFTLKIFLTVSYSASHNIESKSEGKRDGVRKRCRDRGEKRKKTQRGLLAKLSHCDSKSSFNKVHAVYNFIIFS